MKPDSYLQYLETIVLSLMTERDSDKDIVVKDDFAPDPLQGATVSPINVLSEIDSQRRLRLAGGNR
jgi:hypothetical protein